MQKGRKEGRTYRRRLLLDFFGDDMHFPVGINDLNAPRRLRAHVREHSIVFRPAAYDPWCGSLSVLGWYAYVVLW